MRHTLPHYSHALLAQLKAHPMTTSLLGFISGTAGVWFAENAQVMAGWSATLLSIGTFIINAPKIAEQLRAWAVVIRRWACRCLIWALRRLRYGRPAAKAPRTGSPRKPRARKEGGLRK